MRSNHATAAAALLAGLARALPSSPTSPSAASLSLPDALPGIPDVLEGVLGRLTGQVEDLSVVVDALVDELADVVPTATPTSIEDVVSVVQSVAAASPTALLGSTVELVLNGLGPDSLEGVAQQYSIGSSSPHNNNTRVPAGGFGSIYPQAGEGDVRYSVDEETLRAAIYIPDTFTYGEKHPVIMVPGTATMGGFCYESNLGKLLPQEDYADPVWLNVPGFLLEDVPFNSEFVAYAINYISGISQSRNVSVIATSQGNLDTQWALTYWPSTRGLVSDYIAVSPDYHGTVLLNVLCPSAGLLSCPPAGWQQVYTSRFIEAFRAAGGADAYVPTTTVYTGTDDVVQPQHGRGASAWLGDARGVGVRNVELQVECPLLSPALVGTHESPLWGAPLSALIKDALTHEGPAVLERVPDWVGECSKIAAEGLNLADVVGTTAAIPLAFVLIFTYPNRSFQEPSLPAYALEAMSS